MYPKEMLTAWTTGDIHGIGPEIVLKSFREIDHGICRPFVVGSATALRFYNRKLDLSVTIAEFKSYRDLENATELPDDVLPVLSVAEPADPVNPGVISEDAGHIAMKAIDTAARLCLEGKVRAMVTAPIHKEAIAKAGYSNTGHTDFLAELCGISAPAMLFYDPRSTLTVALATVHVPLLSVPNMIRSMDLESFLLNLAQSLRTDFHIASPRIAVLGLNPHASDGGVIGTEEETVLAPCIGKLSAKERIEGPFPADGFFGAGMYRDYDAVVAMYHDQGLLPFKVLAFETGINVTTGLPVIRTSPDHGTGFDIAGLNRASPRSFTEAAIWAERIADNRAEKSTAKS